jgi:hypothetical protein
MKIIANIPKKVGNNTGKITIAPTIISLVTVNILNNLRIPPNPID